jgi:Fe-S cluster biogenesis protein NfuA
MTTPADAGEFQAKLQRLEALVRQAERLPDPTARAQVRDVVSGLLELHAVGLERLLDHVAAVREVGDAILEACAADELVGGLLLLHGLHPHGFAERVEQAVDELRLLGHDVELLGVDDGFVRVRVEGGCNCSSSAAVLRQTIEEAVLARAPDLTAVEIEGLEVTETEPGRVALPVV